MALSFALPVRLFSPAPITAPRRCARRVSPRCSANPPPPPPPPPPSDSGDEEKTPEPAWDVLSQRISALRTQQEELDKALAQRWRTGRFVSTLTHIVPNAFVRTMAFEANYLVCGTSDGEVHFVHTPSTVFLAGSPHDGAVTATAYANGVLASAGTLDRTVALWDAAELERENAQLRAADDDGDDSSAFSADISAFRDRGGIPLGLGGAVNTMPEPRLVLSGHNGVITAIVVGPSGKVVHSASTDGTVRSYDTTNGHLVCKTRVGEPVHAMLLTNSGHLLTACASGRVHAYSADKGLFLLSVVAHKAHATALAFDDETQTLATGDATGMVKLWALEESRCLVEAQLHSDAVVALQIDGAKVLSAGRDGQIAVSERTKLNRLYALGGFTKYIRSAMFDRTRLIADGTNDLIIAHHFDPSFEGAEFIEFPDG